VIKDGVPTVDPNYPNQVPRSGWLVIDTMRTGLTSGFGTRDLFNKFLNKTKIAAGFGYGFEAGQIVRKVSIINSNEEYLRISQEENDALKDQMKNLNAATRPIQPGFKGYFFAGIK